MLTGGYRTGEPGRVQLRGGLVDAGLDLLTGSCCAGCSRPGRALCPVCAQVLTGLRPRAGRPEPPPPALVEPTVLPLVCAAAYAGLVRDLVVAHKEERRLSLAGPLGRLLATAVELAVDDMAGQSPRSAGPERSAGGRGSGHPVGFAGRSGPGSVLLVPVPSTPEAVRARGHDPLLRITRVAASRLRRRGVACGVGPVLVHRREVADQAGLTATERMANLDGAFRVRGTGPTSRSIIVVDDVVTTGASLAAAVSALRVAGREPVAAATIAATVRRNPAG